jgi:hypothetical protein
MGRGFSEFFPTKDFGAASDDSLKNMAIDQWESDNEE